MKTARQNKLLEIIEQNDIYTQEELTVKLLENGYNVTQATISRDLRELGITKMSENGNQQKYVSIRNKKSEFNEKLLKVLKAGYISMDYAENIIVIKTSSGMAMAVAASLDALNWSEIVGCIAGDDTIMCVIRAGNLVPEVMERFKRIVNK